MPFDALAMAAVADEVAALEGGRIQKIVQPSLYAVGLAVYAAGSQQWLLLSADPRFARAQLTTKLAKAFPTPSPFVMLLRKYLDGARVETVQQLPRERVLTLRCRGAERVTTLTCEVMGKHSNIILVDETDVILGAVKLVRPSESRIRPIAPGRPYSPPPEHGRDERLFPPGPRIDPSEHPQLAVELLGGIPEAHIRQALLGLLPGCGPFLADQIALRADVESDVPVESADVERIVAAASTLYALYGTHAWEPCVFLDARERPGFSPYAPLAMAAVERAASMSEAISTAVEDAESRDALGPLRKEVVNVIERSLRAAERRAASLSEGLEATSDAESYMTQGQLVLAYSYAIEPNQRELALPEMEMVIPLQPDLAPAANAERYFRRYRKLRDAREKIPALLADAQREAERLRDLRGFARLADSEGELRTILRDIQPADVGRGKSPRQSGPSRYRRGPLTALVGRNARENEEVTFRFASRGDIWLHARERTGAHVILRGDAEPDEAAVEAAAALAAYFSEGRTDSAVDVDVASVRDVRKIPGGPPGRVTYRNFRTVRVHPGLEEWSRDGNGR